MDQSVRYAYAGLSPVCGCCVHRRSSLDLPESFMPVDDPAAVHMFIKIIATSYMDSVSNRLISFFQLAVIIYIMTIFCLPVRNIGWIFF